jgi:plastocyanin
VKARGPKLVTLCVVALALAACSTDEPATPTDPETALAPDVVEPLPQALPVDVPVGSIEGHVALVGNPPGNRVIRMGLDPKCAQINRGKLVVQEEVVANREGDLANVFVHLQGVFPETAVPVETVEIDQRDCIYTPRVVGARVGQTIEIHNSDDLLHNVHSFSRTDNGFNVGQPTAGMVHRFQPQSEELMLRVGCDVHRWMTTYIGILSHPYFDVTPADGIFRIEGVPAGAYTIRAWHEVFGEITQSVEVAPEQTTAVEFAFSVESGVQ